MESSCSIFSNPISIMSHFFPNNRLINILPTFSFIPFLVVGTPVFLEILLLKVLRPIKRDNEKLKPNFFPIIKDFSTPLQYPPQVLWITCTIYSSVDFHTLHSTKPLIFFLLQDFLLFSEVLLLRLRVIQHSCL